MYEPGYISVSDIETPQDFINAVASVIQYWLDIHTTPEGFYYAWFSGDVQYEYGIWQKEQAKGGNNNLRGWNWTADACYALAKDTHNEYTQCNVCGRIDWEMSYCDDCGNEQLSPISPADLADWFEEIVIEFDDIYLEEAAKAGGFRQYRANIDGLVSGAIVEMEDILLDLRSAEDGADAWSICMRAFEAWHSGGNVVDDYSTHVIDDDGEMFQRVREDGLEEEFEREDIKAFFKGKYYADWPNMEPEEQYA
jgi:hypothetical protein